MAGPTIRAVDRRARAQPGRGTRIGTGRQGRSREEAEGADLFGLEAPLGPSVRLHLPGQDLGEKFGPDFDVGGS